MTHLLLLSIINISICCNLSASASGYHLEQYRLYDPNLFYLPHDTTSPMQSLEAIFGPVCSTQRAQLCCQAATLSPALFCCGGAQAPTLAAYQHIGAHMGYENENQPFDFLANNGHLVQRAIGHSYLSAHRLKVTTPCTRNSVTLDPHTASATTTTLTAALLAYCFPSLCPYATSTIGCLAGQCCYTGCALCLLEYEAHTPLAPLQPVAFTPTYLQTYKRPSLSSQIIWHTCATLAAAGSCQLISCCVPYLMPDICTQAAQEILETCCQSNQYCTERHTPDYLAQLWLGCYLGHQMINP